MTCKAMRLRLLPWIWEHLEPSWGDYLNKITTLRVDRSLASSVKYLWALLRSRELGLTRSRCRFMTLHSLWNAANFPSFVRCLESLPNLHTLAIGSSDSLITTSLGNAFKHCKLPQIKALILPPNAYPLLKCCHNVEDVDCVVGDRPIHSRGLLEFLASIQGSKVRRLAIPLVSSCDTSSKWSAATSWYHMVRMTTNRLRP